MDTVLTPTSVLPRWHPPKFGTCTYKLAFSPNWTPYSIFMFRLKGLETSKNFAMHTIMRHLFRSSLSGILVYFTLTSYQKKFQSCDCCWGLKIFSNDALYVYSKVTKFYRPSANRFDSPVLFFFMFFCPWSLTSCLISKQILYVL